MLVSASHSFLDDKAPEMIGVKLTETACSLTIAVASLKETARFAASNSDGGDSRGRGKHLADQLHTETYIVEPAFYSTSKPA